MILSHAIYCEQTFSILITKFLILSWSHYSFAKQILKVLENTKQDLPRAFCLCLHMQAVLVADLAFVQGFIPLLTHFSLEKSLFHSNKTVMTNALRFCRRKSIIRLK